MKHGSLFSGIGGFDLASEWMGWDNIFQVEIDPFCTQVLQKNFPQTKQYGDIKTFPAANYTGRIDILTGGFPCQPFSQAGKQNGRSDSRHLWPEMLRVVSIIKPTWVIAENVRGLLTIEDGLAFEQVCVDLENIGYDCQPFIIPACSVNAPHKRERIWFIANANSGKHCNKDTGGIRKEEGIQSFDRQKNDTTGKFGRADFQDDWQENIARICRKNDGIPERLDRLKALGNSIVPQVAYQIFQSLSFL